MKNVGIKVNNGIYLTLRIENFKDRMRYYNRKYSF